MVEMSYILAKIEKPINIIGKNGVYLIEIIIMHPVIVVILERGREWLVRPSKDHVRKVCLIMVNLLRFYFYPV